MWLYNGRELTEEEIKTNAGFVYCIHDTQRNMKYIGQKVFHFQKTLPPLKGSKRKRKIVTESDWREYYGSNETLKKIVAANSDPARFQREILYLCKTKQEMQYRETAEIFARNAIISHEYYNDYVTCRIRPSAALKAALKKADI